MRTSHFLSNIDRVIVGLSWTRARAFNPRFGQGWTQCLSPTGWTGQALLTERIDRVRVLVRRIESDTDLCSLERWTSDCCISRNSNWVFSSRIERLFEISGWVRTCRFVRARTLSQLSGPDLGIGFWGLVRRVGLGWKKVSEPNPTATLNIEHEIQLIQKFSNRRNNNWFRNIDSKLLIEIISCDYQLIMNRVHVNDFDESENVLSKNSRIFFCFFVCQCISIALKWWQSDRNALLKSIDQSLILKR